MTLSGKYYWNICNNLEMLQESSELSVGLKMVLFCFDDLIWSQNHCDLETSIHLQGSQAVRSSQLDQSPFSLGRIWPPV